MKQRIIFLISIIAIFILCACSTVDSYIEKGSYGDNLKWTLDNEGTLTISGKGRMLSYESPEDIPWNTFSSDVKSVEVKNGVSNIGDYAFYFCENLKNVKLSASVEEIGAHSFYRCENLERVENANNLKRIGREAFERCTSLSEMDLPDEIEDIGVRAFAGCTNLKEQPHIVNQ